MSTQYSGQPGNISVPAAVNIASSTNATPIVVTTSTAHGLTSGNEVNVVGHAVNYSANGRWPVIVLSPTTLSLTGSAGVGVGAATGTVQSYGLSPTFAEPSDGDDANAASVGVAFDALGDSDAFLAANMGRYKLVSAVNHPNVDDDATESTSWAAITFTATDTWQPIYQIGSAVGLLPNDILDVKVSGSASWTSGCSTFVTLVGLYAGFYVAGGSAPSFGSFTKFPGSGVRLPTAPSGIGWGGFHLHGSILVPSNVQSVAFALFGWCGNATSATLTLLGDYEFVVNVLRPTDFVSRLG